MSVEFNIEGLDEVQEKLKRLANPRLMKNAARRSMRDGLRVLKAARRKLYHLGLSPVARSTFADANNSRPVVFSGFVR